MPPNATKRLLYKYPFFILLKIKILLLKFKLKPNLQTRTYAAGLITRPRLPYWPPQGRKAPKANLL
jgi:hypothetical protein